LSLQQRFKKSVEPQNSPQNSARLLNVKDAAKYIAGHEWYIRTLIRNRQIPYLVVGRGYAVDRTDLDRFIEKQKLSESRETKQA